MTSYSLPVHEARAFDPQTQKALADVFETHTPDDPFRGFVIVSNGLTNTKNPQRILALVENSLGIQALDPDMATWEMGQRIGYAAWLLGHDETCQYLGYVRKAGMSRHTHAAVGPGVLVTWKPTKTPLLSKRKNPEDYQTHLNEGAVMTGALQTKGSSKPTSAHESIERLAHLGRLAEDVYRLQVGTSKKRHLTGHLRRVSFAADPNIVAP